MNLTVRVLEAGTGSAVIDAQLRAYPAGTAGEWRAAANGDGSYRFDDLPEGSYSVAVYGARHVPAYQRVTLPGAAREGVTVEVSQAGFLAGRIVDERGDPPERCWFALFRAGEWQGRQGMVRDGGDHDAESDGGFRSPPLRPAEYILRFAGFLRRSSGGACGPRAILERYFDFLYPQACVVGDAAGFEVRAGETCSAGELRIPRPVLRVIRGSVRGELPGERANLCAHFTRDFGTVDESGAGGGSPLQADGSFEHWTQPGVYIAEMVEFSAPQADGHVRIIRRFGKVRVDATQGDRDGVEIPVDGPTE